MRRIFSARSALWSAATWRRFWLKPFATFILLQLAMSAYIIVEIEILDPLGYEEYKKLAGASVEKYGGKYIMRGGKTEVLEGGWQPKRIVVLEFESAQRAKEWLNCEEYREPRKMRHRTARTNMILVQGM
jgi:uncharacterized protein (DUF1330 family)